MLRKYVFSPFRFQFTLLKQRNSRKMAQIHPRSIGGTADSSANRRAEPHFSVVRADCILFLCRPRADITAKLRKCVFSPFRFRFTLLEQRNSRKMAQIPSAIDSRHGLSRASDAATPSPRTGDTATDSVQRTYFHSGFILHGQYRGNFPAVHTILRQLLTRERTVFSPLLPDQPRITAAAPERPSDGT